MNKYNISAIVKKSKKDCTDEIVEYAEKVYLNDFLDFIKSFDDSIVEATVAISIDKEEE